MTAQRAVIDCRTNFWEHGQLYAALSRVKNPEALCILLPFQSTAVALRPTVDPDVVEIVERITHTSQANIAQPDKQTLSQYIQSKDHSLKSSKKPDIRFSKPSAAARSSWSWIPVDEPTFIWPLPVTGHRTQQECMSAFSDTQQRTDETLSGHDTFRKSSVVPFPRFLFVHLARDCWNGQYHQKDCQPIVFHSKLDISHYCTDKTKRQPYQLVRVVAHLGGVQDNKSHYINFLCVRGQWILYEDTDVSRVNQSEALEERLPLEQDSRETASILPYQSDT
jgi:hypothetical protein